MKVNDIKETKEVVVRTEYIADDGTVFSDRMECHKYEQTCECVIKKEIKALTIGRVDEEALFGTGCEGSGYLILKINNADDLNTINKALCYYWKKAKLVTPDYIGKEILALEDYDCDDLNGYWTTAQGMFDRIEQAIANAKEECSEEA